MDNEKETKEEWYVRSVIERIKTDTAMAAAFKRADNPATEYQAWEYLADFKIDLENPQERIAHITISAAIARAKPDQDGSFPLGAAIASCYEEGNKSSQARSKLRRLLACDTLEEACTIVRPLLRLISSRGKNVAYGRLLSQLLWFNYDPQKIKIKWAQEFFGNIEEAT